MTARNEGISVETGADCMRVEKRGGKIAVNIHPTVAELIPTILGELKPLV